MSIGRNGNVYVLLCLGQQVSAEIQDHEAQLSGFSFYVQMSVYCDLVKAGIIDPVKVVRHALQDAASIAGLLITTEAMVADKPNDKSGPAMPDMGGMGGMGGMM